jgi:hypothetical protein
VRNVVDPPSSFTNVDFGGVVSQISGFGKAMALFTSTSITGSAVEIAGVGPAHHGSNADSSI